MKVKTTLQELLPNEFEVGENEELVAKVSLERLNLIASVIIQQHEEIERLKDIIKEARYYIQGYIPNYDFDKTNLITLLEILQGSDKE